MTVPTFSVHVPKSHRGTIEGPYFVHKCVPQLLLHNIEQDLLSSKPLFNSVCLQPLLYTHKINVCNLSYCEA